MTNSSSFGTGFTTLDASPEEEMHAFDRLPRELRDLLNYSTLDYSAVQLAGLTAVRPARAKAIMVGRRNAAGELVKTIETINAQHGGSIESRIRGKSGKTCARRVCAQSPTSPSSLYE